MNYANFFNSFIIPTILLSIKKKKFFKVANDFRRDIKILITKKIFLIFYITILVLSCIFTKISYKKRIILNNNEFNNNINIENNNNNRYVNRREYQNNLQLYNKLLPFISTIRIFCQLIYGMIYTLIELIFLIFSYNLSLNNMPKIIQNIIPVNEIYKTNLKTNRFRTARKNNSVGISLFFSLPIIIKFFYNNSSFLFVFFVINNILSSLIPYHPLLYLFHYKDNTRDYFPNKFKWKQLKKNNIMELTRFLDINQDTINSFCDQKYCIKTSYNKKNNFLHRIDNFFNFLNSLNITNNSEFKLIKHNNQYFQLNVDQQYNDQSTSYNILDILKKNPQLMTLFLSSSLGFNDSCFQSTNFNNYINKISQTNKTSNLNEQQDNYSKSVIKILKTLIKIISKNPIQIKKISAIDYYWHQILSNYIKLPMNLLFKLTYKREVFVELGFIPLIITLFSSIIGKIIFIFTFYLCIIFIFKNASKKNLLDWICNMLPSFIFENTSKKSSNKNLIFAILGNMKTLFKLYYSPLFILALPNFLLNTSSKLLNGNLVNIKWLIQRFFYLEIIYILFFFNSVKFVLSILDNIFISKDFEIKNVKISQPSILNPKLVSETYLLNDLNYINRITLSNTWTKMYNLYKNKISTLKNTKIQQFTNIFNYIFFYHLIPVIIFWILLMSAFILLIIYSCVLIIKSFKFNNTSSLIRFNSTFQPVNQVSKMLI